MTHQDRVLAVVDAVKNRPADKKISIRKGTPAHQLHNRSWKDACHRVDVSSLNNILKFVRGKDRSGTETLLAVCEGQVTMGQLVKASLEQGFLPQVIPEYHDFTVAGLINGEGIQSSGFRYGVFSHTVTEMEVVLGNGEVVKSTASKNAELFAFMVESYGTLGIVVSATVALRPALPFVRTKYSVYRNVAEFVKAFDPLVRAGRGDFLEGIAFAADCFVTIESTFCSSTEGLPFYDPLPFDVTKGERYYYQYIQQIVLGGAGGAKGVVRQFDVIPTESFVFRSARGLYWMIETYVGFPWLSNQPWFRRKADKKVLETMGKRGFESAGVLTPEETQRCLVQQDMGILLKRLQEGIEWVQANLSVYPLWLCPVNTKLSLKNNDEFLKIHPETRRTFKDDFVCDIGIYGEPTVRPFYHRRVVKALQEFVDAPSMWGVCYKDKEEIRQAWLPIRSKYHAVEAFPGVEEKTTFRGKDDNLDEREIPHWRLVNEYGWYWWIKLPLALVLFFSVVALLFYTLALAFVKFL